MNKKINMYFGLTFLVAGSTFACVSINQHKKIAKNSFFVKRSNKYLANKLQTESNGLVEDLKNALAKEEKISSVYEIENNFYLISNNKLKYFDPNSREFVVISDKNKNAKSIEKIGDCYYVTLADKVKSSNTEMKKVTNGKIENTTIKFKKIKKAFKIGNKEMIFSFDYRPVKDSFYVFCDGQTKEIKLAGLVQYDGIKDMVKVNGSVFIFTYNSGIFKLNINGQKWETKIVSNSKMNIAEVFNFKKDCIFSYDNGAQGCTLYWLNIVENKIEKIDGMDKVGINYAKFNITENDGKFYLITTNKTKEMVKKGGKWSFKDFKNNDGSNFLIKPSTIFKTTINNKKLLYFVGTNNKLYKLSATDSSPILITGIVHDGNTQVVPENKIFKINNIIYYSRFSASNGLVIYIISKDGLSAKKVLESKENKEAPIYSQTKENLYIIFKKETFITGNKNGSYSLDDDTIFNKYNGHIDGIKTINYYGEKINFILTKPVPPKRVNNRIIITHSYLVPNVNFIKKQVQLNNEQILILKKISKFNNGTLILPTSPMNSVYEYKVGQNKWTKGKPNNLNNVAEIWIRLAPSQNTFLSKNNQQNKSNGFLIKLSDLKKINETQKVLLYKDIEFTSGFISSEEQEELIKLRNEATNQYGYNLFKTEYERLTTLNKARQKTGYDKANKNKYNSLGFPNSSNKMTLAKNSDKRQMDDYVKNIQKFNAEANKKLKNAKVLLQKELDKFVNALTKEQINSLGVKIRNGVKNYSTYQEMVGFFYDIRQSIQIKKNNKYNDLGFPNSNQKISLVFDASETERNEYKKSVASFNNAAKLKLEQTKASLQTRLDELKDILNGKDMATLKKKINNDLNDKKACDVLSDQIENIKKNSDIKSKNPYIDLGFSELPSKINLNLNVNQKGIKKFLASVKKYNAAATKKLNTMKEALNQELITMNKNALLSSGKVASFKQKITVGKNKPSLEKIRNILEEVKKNKQTNDNNKYSDLGFKSGIEKLTLDSNAGQEERNAFKKSVANFNKEQTTKLDKAKDILKIKLANFRKWNILSVKKTSELKNEISSKTTNNDTYEEMLAKLQNIQKNYVIIKYKYYIDLGFTINSNKITLELTAPSEQVLEYMKSVGEFNQKAKEQLKKSKESLLTMTGNIKSISDKEKNLLQEEINNNVINNKTYQEVKQKIANINSIDKTIQKNTYNDLGFSGLPEKQMLKHNASDTEIKEYIKSVTSFNNAAKLKLEQTKASLQTRLDELKDILNGKDMATLKKKINNDLNDKKACDVLSDQIENIKKNSDIKSKNPYIDLGFSELPSKINLNLNANQKGIKKFLASVKKFNAAATKKLNTMKEALNQELITMNKNALLSSGKVASFKQKIMVGKNKPSLEKIRNILEEVKKNKQTNDNNKYSDLGFKSGIEKLTLDSNAGQEERNAFKKSVANFNKEQTTKLDKAKDILKIKLANFRKWNILSVKKTSELKNEISSKTTNNDTYEEMLAKLQNIQKNYVIIKYKYYIDLGFTINSNKITLELTAPSEQVLEYMKSVGEFNQKAKEQLKKSKESLLTMTGNIKSISDKEKNLLQEEINNNVINNKTYQEVKQKIANINSIDKTVQKNTYNDLGFSGLPEKQMLKHNASDTEIKEYIKSVTSFNNAAKLKLEQTKALLQTKLDELKDILNDKDIATLKKKVNNDVNDKKACDALSDQIENIKKNSDTINKNPYIDLGFISLPNKKTLELNATQEYAKKYKQYVKMFNKAAITKLEKAKRLLKSNLKKFENILGSEKINSLKYKIRNNVKNYSGYQSMLKKFEDIELNINVLKSNTYNSLGFPNLPETFNLFFDANKESRTKYIKIVKEFNQAAKARLKESRALLKQELNKNEDILSKEQIKIFQKRIENEANNYGSFQKMLLELKKTIQKDKAAAKAGVKKKTNIKWLLIGGIPVIGIIILFVLYRKFKRT